MTTLSRIAPLLVLAAACGRPAPVASSPSPPVAISAIDAGLADAGPGDAAPAGLAAPVRDADPGADAPHPLSTAPADGQIFRRADGTCWWHREITCPANTDCVPPPHRQVACPATGASP